MTIDSTETDNLKALRKSHEKTIKWAKTHESVFASAKYQLIYFRKNIFVNLELFLKLTNHFVNFEEKCKYLKIIINSRLQWQNHLLYLKKQSADKLTILFVFAEFIWDIETEDLRKTYLIIVLSQFIYCASIWYVFTEKHDFKQREKKNNQIFSRHSNASSTNHSRSIQIHFRNSIRNKISFTFNSTTAWRIYLWRTITNNHQSHLRTHTQSKKTFWSRMNARSNSASKNSICSTKFTTQIRNQIRHDIQKKHNQFRKSNFFLSISLMTIVENYHSLNRRRNRQKSRSYHEKWLFSDIHEWQWHRK